MPLSLDEQRSQLLASWHAREAELAGTMTAMLSAAAPATPSAVAQEDAISEDAWSAFLAPLGMTHATRHHAGVSRSSAVPEAPYPVYGPGDMPATLTALSAAPAPTEDAWARFVACLDM